MTDRDRTDHHAYVMAVARELDQLGLGPTTCHDRSSKKPVRATTIRLPDQLGWERCGDDTVSVAVEWDEECGWTFYVVTFLGDPRGLAHGRYGLGRRLVPEPADVALLVDEMLSHPSDNGHARRNAAVDDPALEAALAAYLPT